MCLHREFLALIDIQSPKDGPYALVLRALGLGDLLTAVPALRGLRDGLAGHRIVLAAPPILEPLLPMTGAVDQLLPARGFADLGALDPPPTVAVNLHGRGPQSIDALHRTGAARLLSHRHPDRPGLPGPEWLPKLHERERWVRLLAWSGLPARSDDLLLAPPLHRSPAPGAVVIHPGAASAARRWPPDRYARVARTLAANHRVVITGGPSEPALATEVADRAGLGPAAVLTSLDLTELAALVAEAALVVCGDTGIAHLASAYATRSVVLFGPTPPALWGPPIDGPHTVLWHRGRGDPHAEVVDPCLLQIGVAEVLDAIERRKIT